MLAKDEIRNWTIYKLVSPSGRIYVGKTVNLATRMNHYKWLRCKTQVALYASLVKYGFENHKVEIIESFSSSSPYANGKEMFWIRTNMSNKNKFPEQNGLNLTDGGDGQAGRPMTDENKKKLSEMHKMGNRKTTKGQKRTPEQNEANRQRFLGKPNYKNRGRLVSEETRRKISESNKGNPGYWKGTKGLVKAWNKGVNYSDLYSNEEMKKKFGNHNIGNTYNIGKKRTGIALENIRKSVIEANSVPVIQYDLEGIIMQEFESRAEAMRVTGMSSSGMNKQLKGKIKNPKHFYFKYKTDIGFRKFHFKRRKFKMNSIDITINKKIA